MESSFISSLLIALSVGFASGAIGAFIILRRMALVGDALSHVALPGIALALLYGIDPLWGVWIFLIGAAVIVWWLEIKTTLPAEALVGLLFTASLAVGILLIPNNEIIESLFGEFPELSLPGLFLFIGAAFLLALFSFLFARAFLFSLVSRDLARVEGLGARYDLALFLIFASVVALGIKLVGTLLMGALTIIP
ncbi:MAG: metal ABC transporter permease, partial [Candidatus Portnoybacteria bacterium]|nr:metal ABC transporter permease [Candidatus Portnoybacteria bacterium]